MALEYEWSIYQIIGERKITNSEDYYSFSSLEVFINDNNNVGSQSLLQGNDLGWWLATFNGPRQPPTRSLPRTEDQLPTLLFPN